MVLNKEQLTALDQKLTLELRRGMLTLAVLGALRSPSYGYALKQRLAGRHLEIDQGTLYPLLRRLEADGLLTSEWIVDGSRPRKYYRLSPDGEKTLKALRAKWKSLVGVVEALLDETTQGTADDEETQGETK
ncbi:MAG: PadR family transcriptional regulator [Deltaproteobacteria bacterium]|nr:PadR family transcriptional regulator [Deltaproteobacteria bacterium]